MKFPDSINHLIPVLYALQKNEEHTMCIRDLEILSAMCIWDLDKLHLIWWFGFRREPIFTSAPSAPKNIIHFKSGQKWRKNNHLALFTKA